MIKLPEALLDKFNACWGEKPLMSITTAASILMTQSPSAARCVTLNLYDVMLFQRGQNIFGNDRLGKIFPGHKEHHQHPLLIPYPRHTC